MILNTPSTSRVLEPQSSPYAPHTSSPLATPSRRRTSYNIPSSSPSLGRNRISARRPGTREELPQRQLARERLKARCMQRVEQDRFRALARARGRPNFGMSEASSETGDMDVYDEDDDDELDDETLRRIMVSSNRREKYRHRVSYEEEVGSELGDVDEIEASYGLTSATEDIPNDVDIDLDDPEAEYEAYLASLQGETMDVPHSTPFSDADLAQILPPFIHSLANSGCPCPFCDNHTLQGGPNNTFGCIACRRELSIQQAALSFAAHVQDATVPSQHTPLIAGDPNLGTLFLCTGDACDWCEALD
ncbi:hypothetical protein RhiJN_10261 [Ceratobasidium sp. AG-Ba]|nr:hypothetical protein RhiJN_10261 [Ceratobasidium sp. AG-Ba]QRW11015.1 hypothetical protein RhiLY_10014 [Ceratobasidium sp. AG-Ba]